MTLTYDHNSANAFAGTFAFLPTLEPTQKKQKSLQANAQGQCSLDMVDLRLKRATSANSTYPKGGVLCSKDRFVVKGTIVFQIKFCGKSPALRVAAKRYAQFLDDQLTDD